MRLLPLIALLPILASCADRQIAEMESKCVAGNKNVCQQIAMQHWEAGEKERAGTFFQHACDQGHTLGCLKKADMEENLVKQKALLKRACDLGNSRGCSRYLILMKQSPTGTGSK